MEDVAAAAPKKSTTLSVDRAAFLLLRVKKAFKKKRQQRKEKQQQQTYNSAAIASQSRSNRKVPPPLLRSRTLPAIIVPGIPLLSLHTEKNTFQFEERVGAKSGGNRCWSLLTRHSPHTASNVNLGYGYSSQQNYCTINNNNTVTIKSLNLPKDDTTLVYRRKSSGSTPHSVGGIGSNASSSSSGVHTTTGLTNSAALQQHALYSTTDAASFMHTSTSDEFECHADGTLMLRIPAPHVVAARAYRLASKKHTTTGTPEQHSHQHQQRTSADAHQSTHDTSTTSGSSSGSSSTANTAFTRLAKLLHQTSSATLKPTASSSHTHVDSMHMSLAVAPATGEEAPRRLSWERRKDSSALQRSASIDSFAEVVWSDSPRPSLDIPRPVAPFSKRPSASSLFSNSSMASPSAQLNINYGSGGDTSTGNSRRESLLSPSATRRSKLTRIINVIADTTCCQQLTCCALSYWSSSYLQILSKLLHKI